MWTAGVRVWCALSMMIAAGPAMAQALKECPTANEVKASITKWHTDYNMAETNRSIWKIKSVGNFEFGDIKFGRITQKQVEYRKDAQDTCPVRVNFKYVIESNNGDRKVQERGAGQIHLFYKNAFDEWVFKTENG
jgi:hypothetical protein